MASSDSKIAEDVPNTELIVRDKVNEKLPTISENGIMEEVPISELSAKDKTIEEILKKKSTALLGRKQRKAKNKKSSKVKIRKRHLQIIRSSVNYTTTKSKFDEAMKLLNSPGHLFPNSITKFHCHQRIYDIANCKRYGVWQPLSHSKLLDQARICLQNQDWSNLTKILIYLSSEKLPTYKTLHNTMQYAFLLVLHDPAAKKENFLNIFLENVCGCKNNQEKTNFLEKMFKIPVTKFKPLRNFQPK